MGYMREPASSTLLIPIKGVSPLMTDRLKYLSVF